MKPSTAIVSFYTSRIFNFTFSRKKDNREQKSDGCISIFQSPNIIQSHECWSFLEWEPIGKSGGLWFWNGMGAF